MELVAATFGTEVTFERNVHFTREVAQQLSEFIPRERVGAAIAKVCLRRHAREIGQDRRGLGQHPSAFWI